MANSITLIGSVTVGAGGSSGMSFSSIPGTYTDLIVKFSGRNNFAGDNLVFLSINGTTSLQTSSWLSGTGTATSQGSATSGLFSYYIARTSDAGNTSNTFGIGEVYISQYASSNYKCISVDSAQENNASAAYANLSANLWSSTSAITSLTISAQDGWLQYSTAYLYGIKNS